MRIFIVKIFLAMIFLTSTALATMPEKVPEAENQRALPTTSAVASVTDEARLLDQTQLQQLNTKINRIEQKHGIKIGIVTERSIYGQDIYQVSDALLRSKFNSGGNGNIVLLIVMDNREWNIKTDNKLQVRISNGAGLPYLEDQLVSKLSMGDYAGALTDYVDTVDSLLGYYEQEGQPYNPAEGFNPMAAIAAVVISIFIGVMVRSSLIASMSNVRPAIEASQYLAKESVKITESRDTFLFMNVQRQPKRQGGSNHGSMAGGGGSRGGGGGGSRGGHF